MAAPTLASGLGPMRGSWPSAHRQGALSRKSRWLLAKRRPAMKRSHVLFDVVVLVVYLLAANPALTGIPLHEFVGLGAFVAIAAHVVVSADGLGGRGRVGQLILNAVLLLSLAACVVSGVMVSGTVLPLDGPYAPGRFLGSAARRGGQGAVGGPARARGRARPRRAGGAASSQGSLRRGRGLSGIATDASCPSVLLLSLYCAAG